MASVIAFDVNETLLDLRALDAPFEQLFGSAALRSNANIRDYFDQVVSADWVKHLKSAPQPYQAVANAYGVPTSDVRPGIVGPDIAVVVKQIIATDA